MSVLTDMGFSEVVGHATEHYPFRVSESVKKTDDWFSGDAKVYSCGKYDVIPRLVDLQVFNEWLKDIGTERVSIPNAVAFDWNKIIKEQASKFLGLMRLIEGAGGTEFSHPLWAGSGFISQIEMVDYDGVSEYSQPANAGEAEWWNQGWYLDGGATSTLENLYFGPIRKDGMTDRAWAFSESYYTRAVQAVKESMIGNDPTYFRVPFNSKELASYCKDGMIHPPHDFLKYFYKGGKFVDCSWNDTEDPTLEPKAESPVVKFHDVVFPYILSDTVVPHPDSVELRFTDESMFDQYQIVRESGESNFGGPSIYRPGVTPYYHYFPRVCSDFFALTGGNIITFRTDEHLGYDYSGNIVGRVYHTYSGKLPANASGFPTIKDYLDSWSAVYRSKRLVDVVSITGNLFDYPIEGNKVMLTFKASTFSRYNTTLSVRYDSTTGGYNYANGTGGETTGFPYFCQYGVGWPDSKPSSTPVRYKEFVKCFVFQVTANITCSGLVSIVYNGPIAPYAKYIGHNDDYLTSPPVATNLEDLHSKVEGSEVGTGTIYSSTNHLDREFSLSLIGIDSITSDLNYAKMPIGVYKYNWRNYVK